MSDVKALKHPGQGAGTGEYINPRDLRILKEEIKAESKQLKPILVREIKKGR